MIAAFGPTQKALNQALLLRAAAPELQDSPSA
jgi:hypothetical protein